MTKIRKESRAMVKRENDTGEEEILVWNETVVVKGGVNEEWSFLTSSATKV